MTRTFNTWRDIETMSDYELEHELNDQIASLAYDLKVCGPGYPSPRKDTVRDIIREQERRKARK